MTKTNSINTTQELLAEKAYLQQQITLRKEAINADIRELKNELNPIKNATEAVGNMLVKKHKGWLQLIANVGVDIILSRFLLRRSSLPIRLIFPLLVKNAAGNYIYQHQDQIKEKLTNMVKKWIEIRRQKQMIRKLAKSEVKLLAAQT